MTMQDPISDLLTRMRNAQMAGHAEVAVPNSSIKRSILKVLEDEGYINGWSATEDLKSELNIQLRYHNGVPVMEEIKRISRPGLRIYKESGDLPSVRGGLGIAVISTNKGVMTDKKARAQGVGGEVLCTIF
jgi:small subunit ribosomal protein S8